MTSPSPSPSLSPATTPLIHWQENGKDCSAIWRSERGALAPRRVVLADDTLSADSAYRLACAGTGLLWRGDFQNAKLLLAAMARRIDKVPARKKRKATKPAQALSNLASQPMRANELAAHGFHLHRQAQAQRARILSCVLIPFDADYGIALRRAPDAKLACAEAWGAAKQSDTLNASAFHSVATLRELMGVTSAHEWRKKGIEIAALGTAGKSSGAMANNRIHPHYGVFSPVRGEYLQLVNHAEFPPAFFERVKFVAFDIGTGTGVLCAILARRDVTHIVATDIDARALACATDNLTKLGVIEHVKLVQTHLFPDGKASLIVCNPPWLPARPSSPIERAVYDEGGVMLQGFLAGLAAHLAPHGEGWLLLSDIAEHLGLRTRQELLDMMRAGGLKVLNRTDVKPAHPKSEDSTDPLYAARSQEVTSLWRLAAL
ncbi:MAG: class I SAM-dependent methyltransferase [Cytophagales bacterium]|nr:class I SAM-dependent methyltransferase [Cytophagales bacterium]